MNARQRVLNLLAGSAPDRPVRGEIWPLSSGGSAAEILSAAQGIGADFCFFDQLPGAMAEARTAELATGAIVNGPWQRCLERIGWEAAMTGLARGGEAVREGLRAAAAEAGSEILAWTSAGVNEPDIISMTPSGSTLTRGAITDTTSRAASSRRMTIWW